MVLGTLVAVAACSDDDGTGLADLTEEQARDVAQAVLVAAMGGVMEIPTDPPDATAVGGPAAAPFSYDFDADLTAPCDGGGEVQVEATLHVEGDDETEAGTVEYTMTEVPNDCVVTTYNGNVYTL
ncbi:MAG TPA: hypothetical protein VFQ22_11970, partial [Longimicrobiales bacterium]|nr:hypothetical protein [Longimicrobiales bacterium]